MQIEIPIPQNPIDTRSRVGPQGGILPVGVCLIMFFSSIRVSSRICRVSYHCVELSLERALIVYKMSPSGHIWMRLIADG